MVRWVMVAGICAIAGTAAAQEVDCATAVAQQDMNACAAEEYRAADATLNAVWPGAVSWARGAGLEEELRTAQRAWIAFRDAACAVEAGAWAGGTMEPYANAACMTRLTVARTMDLRVLVGDTGPQSTGP